MKGISKVILLFCLLLNSTFVFSQVENYLDAEKTRIVQAEAIESEIEGFIIQNLDNYSLSQARIDEILQSLAIDTIHGNLSQEEKDMLMLNFKKVELRKLYFDNNPEKVSFFSVTPKPQSLLTECINGGFEDGYSGYSFKRLPYSLLSYTLNNRPSCNFRFEYDTPYGGGTIIDFSPAGTNQHQSYATIVSTAFGGVNEPLLASLGINIPKVRTGTRSLKINPTPATRSDAETTGDFTWVRGGDFTITQSQIQFSFLLIGTVADHYGQAAFGYRLVDKTTGSILRNECIPLDTKDCRFQRILDTRTQGGWNGSNTVVAYTNWVCETINTNDLIDKDVYLEFFVSDCEHRGHYATVYIDDVCGGVSCTPTQGWGNITLDPINVNCPTEPFDVCGTFTMPAGSTFFEMKLSIESLTGYANITPVITGNRFCFTVDPSVHVVVPRYPNLDPAGSYAVSVTVNPGRVCAFKSADKFITFNNCCIPTLVETNFISGKRQRGEWIQISGNTEPYLQVIRHAGNYIELNPGFITGTDSKFSAYIDECNSLFNYKEEEVPVIDGLVALEKLEVKTVNNEIKLYPNPTSNYLTVDYTIGFNQVKITSVDGKTVFNQKSDISNSKQIDVSNLKNGIYTLSIVTVDGNVLTEKLIKN